MSDQYSASLSPDKLPERISTTRTPAPRSARPPVQSLVVCDTGTDRPALEAAWPASAARLQVGIFLHLACIAFVGTAIIVPFFGIALSLLGHPAGEVIIDSGAPDRHMAPVGAKPEIPLSAPTLSVVPSGSAPVPLAGEAPASAAPVAPFRAELPAAATTAPGMTSAMTAFAPTMGTQPGQRLRPSAIAETPGVPPEPFPDSMMGQSGKHSRFERPGNATAEVVHGTVTDARDAMTWVVDDKIVNLWGIRPGSPNLFPSLSGFVDRVRAEGAVECRRQSHSSRYRCLMATGEDLAEAALFAGVGRSADGATVAYRTAEAQAHQAGRGLWAKP